MAISPVTFNTATNAWDAGGTAPTTNPVAVTGVVTSLAKSGSSGLTGAVTLSGGTNVTLTQAGNDISIAASGGGGGSSYLGAVTRVSNFTTASASSVQVTGLTVTVTVPGGTHIKITLSCYWINNTIAGGYCQPEIWDGVVGSGTLLASTVAQSSGAGQNMTVALVALVAPAAGSKTYNVGMNTQGGGGTAQMGANANAPALLLVESI